ncbi:polysaccharide deacetylase family protein [Taibaiella chishuiensis]|uniref:Polysaccharide deacetylase n=1 Tax=Taibaiella chishuiensis TaxID=1434707 RepID=A0A2P8D7X0_9BACT|nr:polysaccharide deacetylase family protein [Taibaiella chishuiensis]PSK93330.1 polysaccharide deacetylase [Taibaiella chishuiensis]
MSSRRDFIRQGSLIGAATLLQPASLLASAGAQTQTMHTPHSKWADGSRLIISVSMQFEAGGEPANAESPFPHNMQAGYTDLPAQTWYAYGYKEGIPRMLDLWDKFGIKVTSHMVGSAVLKNPDLAREIVTRGHEAAAHGMNWATQYTMPYEEERRFIKEGADAVHKVTGATPVGYNANWLRRGDNTLKILQELGFRYHIDDISRDEPYILQVNEKDFAVVPYTLRCNDIVLIEGRHFSAGQFLEQLKLEFNQLYEESATRRRMMSVSFHDRIGGTPQVVQAAKEFFAFAAAQKGVVFRTKKDIADMTLQDKTSIRE